MAIQKLKALEAHLLAQNWVDENLVLSSVEDAVAIPRCSDNGNSLTVCEVTYTGVVQIDSFSGNEDLFYATVVTWLMDNDKDRDGQDLEPPQIDITVRDDSLADLDIAIQFKELVHIVEDVNGPLTYRGKQWSLGAPVVHTAESGAVSHSEGIAHDAEYTHTS